MEKIYYIKNLEDLKEVISDINSLGKAKKCTLNFVEAAQIDFCLPMLKQLFKEINYQNSPLFCLQVNYLNKNGFLLDDEKNLKLKEIEDYLKDINIPFRVGQENFKFKYKLEDQIKASKMIDQIAQDISNLSIENEEGKAECLSPFEKFIFAYEFVSGFVYNEGGDIFHENTNYWVPALLGDKIVCGGYSSLMEALCERLFKNNEVGIYNQATYIFNKDFNFINGHSNILVKIKDEKYNIDGVFYADPCWDSVKDENSIGHAKYCLLTEKELSNQENVLFLFNGLNPLNFYWIKSNDKYRDFINKLYKEYFADDLSAYNENGILKLQNYQLMRSVLSYLKLFVDNEKVVDDFLSLNQDELISGRASKLFALKEECRFDDLEEGKKLLKQKLLEKEYETRMKEEGTFELCCQKCPQIESLICPNNIGYIQSEPIANEILTKLRFHGYKALDEQQLYYLCKLMALKEDEYKSFIAKNEADEGHLSLKDFLKVYAERFYYLPKIENIERNINFAFYNEENQIAKNWQETFKMAFNVPSISSKSFRAAFTKLGKFYQLDEENLQTFVDYKMRDINLRYSNQLQEEESAHKK